MKVCEPLLCCTKCDLKAEGEKSSKTESRPEVRQQFSQPPALCSELYLFTKSSTQFI